LSESETKEPDPYITFIKCGKAVKGEQENLDIVLSDVEHLNSLQIKFWRDGIVSFVWCRIHYYFGAKLFSRFNGQ